MPRLTAAGAGVVAVFDSDRVHRLPGIQPTDSMPTVTRRILDLAGGHGELHVVLLERNVESLVRAAARVQGQPDADSPPKSPIYRDRVLNSMAFSGNVSQRREVRCAVAGLGDIVEALVAALGKRLPRVE